MQVPGTGSQTARVIYTAEATVTVVAPTVTA